jgi:hypothetical protein
MPRKGRGAGSVTCADHRPDRLTERAPYQGSQTAVAPRAAGRKIIRRRTQSALTLNRSDKHRRPFKRIRLLPGEAVIHRPEILAIFCNAVLPVEVNGLERPHKEPSQPQAVGDCLIHILYPTQPILRAGAGRPLAQALRVTSL